MNASTDAELARQTAFGARDAFAELVRRYEGRLINVLLRRVPNYADAEDLAQHAFLRAWQAIDRYDDRWRFSTWLFTIALRHASDVASRRAVNAHSITGRDAVLAAPDPGEPATALVRREAARNLWRLADQVLNSEERLALWLRFVEELPARDIAGALGRTSAGVRILVHRARRRLQDAAEAVERQDDGGTWPSDGARLSDRRRECDDRTQRAVAPTPMSGLR